MGRHRRENCLDIVEAEQSTVTFARRYTEWRPRGAAWQFGGQRRAADGELIRGTVFAHI